MKNILQNKPLQIAMAVLMSGLMAGQTILAADNVRSANRNSRGRGDANVNANRNANVNVNRNVGGNVNVNRNVTLPKGNFGVQGAAKGAAKGTKQKGQQ